VVRTTEDHPFWNETDREWQRADQLDSGDFVLTSDGRRVKVGVLVGSAGRGSAYNFTVEGLHTYHVLFGTDAVLVHNAYNCAKDALKIQKRLGEGAERYQVGNSSPGTKPMPMDSSHPLDTGRQGWSWHEFVVKDGLAYDKSFPKGIALDDYLKMFPGQAPVKVG
jgi:Pretoxin HINT domain